MLAGRVAELYESCTGLFEKFLVRGQRAVSDYLKRDIDPHPHPLGDAPRGLDQPMPSSARAADAVELAQRSGVTERLGERAKEQPRAGRPGWVFTQCAEITGDFQVAA